MDLPGFESTGHLPAGIYQASLWQLNESLVFNPRREILWQKFLTFLQEQVREDKFSRFYVGGGFVSNKTNPGDIDVILQTRAVFGKASFLAMSPFFSYGLDEINRQYQVHLHFWADGFPGKINDFRRFFQYMKTGESGSHNFRARKGIIRVEYHRADVEALLEAIRVNHRFSDCLS